ncbi:hypothetical protein Rhe02_54990 [Rhizocola hellebori]|uniref:Uncharacterized protein n=1 Tax=Rhizocola hellebori TaxID=1392758 RepID=A0A8J3QD42_9ACTN|nr:hypothetical protein [Rhizocola hellebori]GIH07432.1 hypothetical protein Rhe02_54990 [Rhizocola hellebori]
MAVLAGAITDPADLTAVLRMVATMATYTPELTSSSGSPTIGNGTLTGRYLQSNGLAYVQIQLTRGSTTDYGTGFISLSVPIPALSVDYVGACTLFDASANSFAAACQMETTTSITPVSSSGVITSTSPFTWATSDRIRITILYEHA